MALSVLSEFIDLTHMGLNSYICVYRQATANLHGSSGTRSSFISLQSVRHAERPRFQPFRTPNLGLHALFAADHIKPN